ncbi:MAG: hypothetical protein JEZ00_21030 [Anaerolineaceae bacterium]|nr:hypothetical protein [Anaerolineaceae bacterium]
MTQKLIVENEFGSLWYHPEHKIVHHQWHKFIYGDVFRELLLKGTSTMKENGANKWLSDDRKNPAVRKEDMEWGQTNWFPQSVQAGWKYWAIVQPEAVIAQMNMKQLVETYSQAGIEAQFFTSLEEAQKWLESKS